MTAQLRLRVDDAICSGCGQPDLHDDLLNQCPVCEETRCDRCYAGNGCPTECAP